MPRDCRKRHVVTILLEGNWKFQKINLSYLELTIWGNLTNTIRPADLATLCVTVCAWVAFIRENAHGLPYDWFTAGQGLATDWFPLEEELTEKRKPISNGHLGRKSTKRWKLATNDVKLVSPTVKREQIWNHSWAIIKVFHVPYIDTPIIAIVTIFSLLLLLLLMITQLKRHKSRPFSPFMAQKDEFSG